MRFYARFAGTFRGIFMQLNEGWPQGFMPYIREGLKGSRMSPLDVVIAVKELAGADPYGTATPEQVAHILSMPFLDFTWLTNAILKHEDGPQCEATLEWLAMFYDQSWIDLKRVWRSLKADDEFFCEGYWLSWLQIPALNTDEWRKKALAGLKADESGYSMALNFYELAKVQGADVKACFRAANKAYLSDTEASNLTEENIAHFEALSGLRWHQ